jgi:hypothetical protein
LTQNVYEALMLADADFEQANFSQALQKYNRILTNYRIGHYNSVEDIENFTALLKVKIDASLRSLQLNGGYVRSAENSDVESNAQAPRC